MSKLTVVRVERALLGTFITVSAAKRCSFKSDSLFGEREHFLKKNHRLRIRVKGKDWWEGDRISMRELVLSSYDWASIPWAWS